MTVHTFVVDRANLHRSHWIESAPRALADGEARFHVDAFGLTANNITYAAFGETMHYWDFYPTGDASTGCVPVWGFAHVTESRCAGIAAGEKFYGYWPMADEAVLQPVRVEDSSFVDGAPHRRELHAVYNQYLRCSADPGYRPDREAEQALLRPLFVTSFLIDDFLADNAFFRASQVVMSSASSKTAYGTAFCLARRRGAPGTPRVIGLTSAAHLEFTRGLGCYDAVIDYDTSASLAATEPTVYVDFSGNAALRERLHRHFDASLTYSCSVGGTHWDALGSGQGLPGPRPKLFFAPAQIQKRLDDWGQTGLQQRQAEAWLAFMKPVTDRASPWLRVMHGQGRAAVDACYAALLEGHMDPREGHLLSV